MNFTWIKYNTLISILFVCCCSLNAQNDIALSISSNLSVTEIGEELTFSITVENIKATDVEGLKIHVNIPSILDYIDDEISTGATFSVASGEWNIFNQLNSNTDSLNLKLTLSPNAEGTHFITAEIIEMIGFDFNSTVQNGDFLEDDFAVGCIAVPIEMGQNYTVQLVAPAQFTEAHQWYETTTFGNNLVSTNALFSATTPGVYRYKNTVYGCQQGACCDIVLVERLEPCIITAYANTICKNNSTLNDSLDDIFVVDIQAVAGGSGFSDNYLVLYNETILNIGGTNYGENIIVAHPGFISDGISAFNITIQDANDPDCQQEIEIIAPQECSTGNCNLYAKLQENNCCEECRSGNLELKLAHWQEEFKELSSVNVAKGKPSDFNNSPFGPNTSSYNSTDGLYAGEFFGGFDYSFSSTGNYNYWDVDLEEIKIFAKDDCCGGDAINYRIFVSSEPFNTT
jgi:hypothetical protein